jgi:sugar phosphate isomerase/epimerase
MADPDLRISLASWSMHRMFFEEGLDLLGMVDLTAEFGIEGLEFVNTFFPSPQFRYLEGLRDRCAEHGIVPLLIMCDGEGNLAATDPGERKQAVKNHHKWIDIAEVLGCHSIRVNIHGDVSDPNAMRDRAAEALASLCEYSDAARVDVIIENHGNREVGNLTPAADPDWIVSLVEAAGHARLGTLPDFGNWAPQIDRYEAVAAMMPHARGVSAKCYTFDDDGGETEIDFARMVGIVRAAGYHGFIGIEYEEYRGMRRVRDGFEPAEGDVPITEREGIAAAKRLLEGLL